MISVYKDADYLAAYKQKKRILSVFWAITFAYLAYCIAWLVYYIGLPYEDPMQILPEMCVYVMSAVYVIVIFPYMSIKFSRIRRYFKMLTYVSTGLKNEEKNYFYCFDENNLQKDNIDVVSCVFETWNKKKCEWMEREAYHDPEMPLPDFESGDFVHYIVQSNFVIQYEILQKKALEFEEVEDEDVEEVIEETAREELPAGTEEEQKIAEEKEDRE
ncbi:MAG: hypothetical protein IJF44_06345 [Clostridia bacterium]|nr:hypothetical protein [Clostridia bacterium]